MRAPGLLLAGSLSFLPIAEHGASVDFEAHFRTPHGLDFEHAASLFGGTHTRVESWSDYRDAIRSALPGGTNSVGTRLIEVHVDRDANVKHFRELIALASRAWRSRMAQ